MHSFQVNSIDSMALLENTTAAIGTRFDRTIATSHAKLLERIAAQDKILLKQQEMVEAISEKIVNLQTRLPGAPWLPSSTPSLSYPYASSSNVDHLRDIYMEMRHLKDIVEEGYKSSASSTRTGLEELRNAMNTRFTTVENQLKELRSKNVHVQDRLFSHFQPSGSPPTVITQRWKDGNDPPDLEDEYEEYHDETLVCVNPLDTVKNVKLPRQIDHSTPHESSTQFNSTNSLPAMSGSPDAAGISLNTSSAPTTARSSYNSADSPLTNISELEGDPSYDNTVQNAQGNSSSSKLLPKKRTRRPRAAPTSTTQSPHPRSRPRKQRRLNAEDALQSSRRPRTSGKVRGTNKTKQLAPSAREASQASDDIWPKQGGATDTSHQFIQCDRCQSWFHWGCVGIDTVNARRMTGDDTEFICPPCTANNVEWKSRPKHESAPGKERCSRPGCTMRGIAMEEFFIERFVGRYDRRIHGPARYAWLIQWEGYSIDQCDWTPENEIEAPGDYIDRFEREAKSENSFASQGPLVLLKEAVEAGWDKRLQ